MVAELKVPNVLTKMEYLKLPPQERELYVREILRQTINMNEYGATISSLTKQLPFDSRTLEKHLSILTYTNEIYTVKIGPTTLYLPNGRPMHPVTEKKLSVGDTEFSVYLLENRLGQFAFIQEKKRRGYAEDIGGGILVPRSSFSRFVDYLQKIAKDLEKAE